MEVNSISQKSLRMITLDLQVGLCLYVVFHCRTRKGAPNSPLYITVCIQTVIQRRFTVPCHRKHHRVTATSARHRITTTSASLFRRLKRSLYSIPRTVILRFTCSLAFSLNFQCGFIGWEVVYVRPGIFSRIWGRIISEPTKEGGTWPNII